MMDDVTKWVNKFKRVLKDIPNGVEIIVTNSTIEVWKAGSLAKHIGSRYDGYGIGNNPELEDGYITGFENRYMEPYTEGA